MFMKYVITAVLLFVLTQVFGNDKETKERIAPNSGQLIQQGIKLHDDEQYKEAIAVYTKIPSNDTNYVLARFEIALSYSEDSMYAEAIKVLEEVKSIPSLTQPEIFSLLASCYDKNGEFEKSLKAFDEGIAIAPASYLLYYNKAITLEREKRYQEAFENYKSAVLYSPTHVGSNFRLGLLCYKSGMITEAMMAFLRAILSNPTTASFLVGSIEDIADYKESGEISVKEPFAVSTYDDIKMVLLNKVALDSKYKLKTKIDYKVIRQLQAMMELMVYEKNNPNFFNQQYARLYQDIFSNNLLTGFAAYVLQGVESDKVQADISKYQSDAQKFRSWLSQNLQPSFNEILVQNGSVKETKFMLYNDNFLLQAIGKLNAEKKMTGKWDFYFTTGRKAASGNFNNGTKEGLFVQYFDNGFVKDSSNYKNDKLIGVSTNFDYQGYLSQRLTYRDGLLEGKVINYYPSGLVKNTIAFKADERNGLVETFYPSGVKDVVMTYKNGLLEGERKEYYTDGSLYEVSNYKAGLLEGKTVAYFANGKVMNEKLFAADKPTGIWKFYHENGQMQRTGNYVNGTTVGVWKFYDMEGNLIEEQLLDESGKLNGIVKEYAPGNKLVIESNYVKGELQSYKCWDINGKLLQEQKKSKGQLKFFAYYPDGTLDFEGLLQNDQRVGEWKFYHRNGALAVVKNYLDGLQTGSEKGYFQNGALSYVNEYEKDELNGICYDYYSNGKIREITYYKNGQQNGFTENYNALGDMTSKEYRLDGDLTADNYDYYPNGQVSMINKYHNKQIVEYTELDSTGKLLKSFKPLGSSDIIVSKLHNGKDASQIPLKGLVRDGAFKIFHGNGQLKVTGTYQDGDRVGLWKWYDELGNVESETNFHLSRKHGSGAEYHPNGQVSYKGEYLLGNKVGPWNQYYPDGKIEVERHFKNNNSHGRFVYYAPSGEVSRILYFEDDFLVAYAHLDKAGQEIARIPVISKGAFNMTTYYANGQKAWDVPLKDGWWDGKITAWYPDGKIWRTGTYYNDLRQGSYVNYYENGKVMSEEMYEFGLKHGVCKYFDINGNLEKEISYYDDEPHGVAKYYKDKKLIRQITFYHGEVISQQ